MTSLPSICLEKFGISDMFTLNSKLFVTISPPKYSSAISLIAVFVWPNINNFFPFLTACLILKYKVGRLSLMS